ncbi:hypothetical protein PR001_g3714 [Phytophthora rubi]|uniref:Uncharacterized protein n=1 Tax=Phytophthora rubi TaxID=129364 RepID=A0A6A3NT64_9STRA|nr:hypothetical protein PR001_g3714 [Phytophthora rubi]
MKGGPFGPAITTGGAAFAALGSLLANRVPPSLRSAAFWPMGCRHRCARRPSVPMSTVPMRRTGLTHTHADRQCALVEGGRC